MRDLNISHLRTLVAISETGSFGAAAARVGRTQSAVTQQMHLLEETVGQPLFEAHGRVRRLTEAGEVLLRHSREILSMCEQAMSASATSGKTGVIRLGAPLEVGQEVLPGVLESFSQQWPGVRVVFHVLRSGQLMRMLNEGHLDLTFSTWQSGSREGVRVKLLPVHWIAPRDWKMEPGKPLPLVLTDEPSVFRRIGLSALDLSGHRYYEKFTSNYAIGVRLAVEAGLGITPRTTRSFGTDIKILGPEANLPALPHVSYYLHRSSEIGRAEVDDLYQMIVDRADAV